MMEIRQKELEKIKQRGAKIRVFVQKIFKILVFFDVIQCMYAVWYLYAQCMVFVYTLYRQML